MKMRTVCLPPGDLLPGMIVASPICGTQGGVLLPAGAVLDEATLAQLRRRSIAFLTVQVPDTRDDATIAHAVDEAASRVDFIFRGDGSAQRDLLRQAIADYRRRQAE